jgi:hypothetical protein
MSQLFATRHGLEEIDNDAANMIPAAWMLPEMRKFRQLSPEFSGLGAIRFVHFVRINRVVALGEFIDREKEEENEPAD